MNNMSYRREIGFECQSNPADYMLVARSDTGLAVDVVESTEDGSSAASVLLTHEDAHRLAKFLREAGYHG